MRDHVTQRWNGFGQNTTAKSSLTLSILVLYMTIGLFLTLSFLQNGKYLSDFFVVLKEKIELRTVARTILPHDKKTIPPTANKLPKMARTVGCSRTNIHVTGMAYKGPTDPSVNAKASVI